MLAETSTARGRCLIEALIVWITPDHPLGPGLTRFQVRVSDDGGTWLERYGDRCGPPVGGGARAPTATVRRLGLDRVICEPHNCLGSHAVGGQVLHGVDQMGEVAAQAVDELSSRRSCLRLSRGGDRVGCARSARSCSASRVRDPPALLPDYAPVDRGGPRAPHGVPTWLSRGADGASAPSCCRGSAVSGSRRTASSGPASKRFEVRIPPRPGTGGSKRGCHPDPPRRRREPGRGNGRPGFSLATGRPPGDRGGAGHERLGAADIAAVLAPPPARMLRPRHRVGGSRPRAPRPRRRDRRAAAARRGPESPDHRDPRGATRDSTRNWRACPRWCRSSATGSRCGSAGRRTRRSGSTRWLGTVTGITLPRAKPPKRWRTGCARSRRSRPAGRGDRQVIVDAGPQATARFLEFFAGAGLPPSTCCHTFPGDRDHGVPVERGDARARAADRGARIAEDDEALRPNGGHGDGGRDRAYRRPGHRRRAAPRQRRPGRAPPASSGGRRAARPGGRRRSSTPEPAGWAGLRGPSGPAPATGPVDRGTGRAPPA